MAEFSEKAFAIFIGDKVRIAVGRGWRIAKVIGKENNILKVKDKAGNVHEVQAEQVMTDEETKEFRRSGGQTRVMRSSRETPLEVSNNPEENDEHKESSKIRGVLNKFI